MLDGIVPYVHTQFKVSRYIGNMNDMGIHTSERTFRCRVITMPLQ